MKQNGSWITGLSLFTWRAACLQASPPVSVLTVLRTNDDFAAKSGWTVGSKVVRSQSDKYQCI